MDHAIRATTAKAARTKTIPMVHSPPVGGSTAGVGGRARARGSGSGSACIGSAKSAAGKNLRRSAPHPVIMTYCAWGTPPIHRMPSSLT